MKPLHIFRNTFILTLLFIVLGTLGFNPPAGAVPVQSPARIYLNDEQIDFEVNPIAVNGRTLVPVKKIFEIFGAALNWDEKTQTVTACNSTKTVTLTIGSYNATVNGKVKNLNEPAQIIEGQTFAPLSFLVEAYDCEMNWDEERQLIKIYCGQGQQTQMAGVPAAAVKQTPANPVSAVAAEQSGPVLAVTVTANDLHIRSGPSTSSDVIGLVPCGTILAYVGEADGWYQVKYQGCLGWAAGWYCTPPSTDNVSRGIKMTLLPVPSDPEAFVRQMRPYAETASKGTGLPVNFLLAQWAEECGYGTSSLAQYYNNFGGIKDPDTGGFEQYATPDEFARDVVRIYTEYPQFAKLLADARDGASLKTLFNDLSRCGYASSSSYGEKIRTQYLPTIDEILEYI
ncbi:MAG: stalk domain-containing protein [Syntrophomonadaceae bacterium]